MTEWQVFGALVVGYLGMPVESIPFYKDSKGIRRKAKRVLERVIKNGNFGHNNDLSYITEYSGIVYKVVALWRRLMDFMKMSPIFPVDGPRFFVRYAIGKLG